MKRTARKQHDIRIVNVAGVLEVLADGENVGTLSRYGNRRWTAHTKNGVRLFPSHRTRKAAAEMLASVERIMRLTCF